MPGLHFDAYLVSKDVKVHDFMPDLKVGRFGRFMSVVIFRTKLLFLLTMYEITQEQKAKHGTHFSSLTISSKSLLFTLADFNEIQMPFSKSASKTLSPIQSTAKYIFLHVPSYENQCKNLPNMMVQSRILARNL